MSVQTATQPFTATAARVGTLNHNLIAAIQIGLIGGLVAVLMGLEGMVEVLAVRDFIAGIIGLGVILVLLTFYLSGQLALARTHGTSPSPTSILTALIAGLTAAVLVALLVLVYTALPDLRNIFVNTSQKMVALLTFNQSLGLGIALLLMVGAGLGALAGALQYLRPMIRRAVVNTIAWMILLALLQELIRITGQNFGPLRLVASSLFPQNGFTPVGAAATFIVIFAIYLVAGIRGQEIRSGYRRLSTAQGRSQQQTLLFYGLLAVAALFLLVLPQVLGLFPSETLVQTGLFVLMGLGLNIVVGFAGLLDLGYVAFFAIGAYTMAFLTSPEEVIVTPIRSLPVEWQFWAALGFSVLAAIFAGVLLGIPVLRIRGDYLAIVTLGFGEIIRLLALSDLLKPWLGDGLGMHGVPKPYVGPIELGTSPLLYYLVLAGCLVVLFVSTRLKNSRLGRAWIAVREDEDVAQSMGINLITTKLLAFAMGASFAGLAGAIFASKLQTIYPHSFALLISINVLAVIIIGGMGSIPGVIVGALALVGIPELLREFTDFRLMLYGAMLVLMMLVRPEGLIPEARRREELEEFKEEEEVMGTTLIEPTA